MSDSATGPNAVLSFLGCVNIAVDMARKQYSQARLLEVDATPTHPGHPSPIKTMRVVFGIDNQTLMMHMTQWGEFTSQVIPEPWLGDMVINWPIKMDIVEADALLKAHGFRQAYTAVTLRWPLYPGNTEPYYIFTIGLNSYVFVGVNDKKVFPYQQPATTGEAAK